MVECAGLEIQCTFRGTVSSNLTLSAKFKTPAERKFCGGFAFDREVLQVIEDLAADGMTMITVTHEMGFGRNVAGQVL